MSNSVHRSYRIAFRLALFTIFYNLLEGIVSIYFGYEDGTFTLFGFGIDSFIEAISGIGIAHMVMRIQRSPESNRDAFEQTALRVTGSAFYTLAAGLVIMSIGSLWTGHKPETTFWGVVIALISIFIMWALVAAKNKVGNKLHSEAILADARCTKVCIYMSVVLLIASGLYELTKISYIDVIGMLGLAYFSLKEGRESFEKARGDNHCNCGNDHKETAPIENNLKLP